MEMMMILCRIKKKKKKMKMKLQIKWISFNLTSKCWTTSKTNQKNTMMKKKTD